MNGAAQAVTRHLHTHVTDTRRLGGSAFLATTADGATVVAKQGAGHGAATAEAAGLRWLGEHGDVPVPRVHGDDEDWLVLDYVPGGRPEKDAAQAFGRALAAQHLRGAPAFGSPPPGGPTQAWMGLAPMRNEPYEDWPTFYARQRIEPYVRTCVDNGLLASSDATVFDEVCARLGELTGSAEPPARLHGDAWSGNVHWAADGRTWLIDPAAHGGHRETDLAMLELFGVPLLEHILGSYGEAATDAGRPLAAGRPSRVGVHQLFPVLMHAVVFGGGYAQQARSLATGALR